MSSFGSYESLSCSSPSDNKNFSSSTDDPSELTSANSLNAISTCDLSVGEDAVKPRNEGGGFLQALPPDAMEDKVAGGLDPVRNEAGPKGDDAGGADVVGGLGLSEEARGETSDEDDDESFWMSRLKDARTRKRLREESEDDDDDDEDDNRGDDRTRSGVNEDDNTASIPEDGITEELVGGDTNEDEEEEDRRRGALNMLLSSASSSSSSSYDSSDVEEMLHGDFFLSRFNDSKHKTNGKVDDKKKNDISDEINNFHRKILKLNLHREMGFPNKKFNNAVTYHNQVVGDVDVVKKFGLMHRYEKHSGCVNCLHFNEPGNLIASGSDDVMVVIYDWIKEKVCLSFITRHKENIFQTKFMPHSRDSHILTCARDGQVRVAQLSTTGSCRSHKKLAFHKGAAHKLALIQDSAHEFYSCGEDGVTHQIDLRQEKPCLSFTTKHKGKKVALYSVHTHPSKGYEVCVVGRDPYVRIYDVRNVSKNDTAMKKFCPDKLESGFDHITSAVYNHNGTEIVASYNDDDIYLFDSSFSDGASHIKQYEGHRNSATVKGVNFYGNKCEYIVSGSDCGNVFIWEKETANLVNLFHADDTGMVNVIENHPTLPLIATSGLDSDVKLWSPDRNPASSLEKFNQEKKKGRNKPKNRLSSELDDNSLLWFLMRTFSRRSVGVELSSDSSDDFVMDADEDEDNQDDADEDGTDRSNIQCASS